MQRSTAVMSTGMAFDGLHPARWWHSEGHRFRCELCPRRCLLSPGQRGFCFSRLATEDGIALAAYGKAIGLNVEPIEKKPLYHFHPGSAALSFGTAGCNLGCRFCQNWDMTKSEEAESFAVPAEPEEIARSASELGCESVAFTFNDPVVFAEYAIDTAKECKMRGVHTVAVTAGYVSGDARRELFSVMDAANIDLKAFDDRFYRKHCLGSLQPVRETIAWVVKETSCWVELTNLIIPGLNDDPEGIHALAEWVGNTLGPEVPLHFTAFHPAFKMLDRPRTPITTLLRAREIATRVGLRWVYIGNAIEPYAASTWCEACDALLISRRGYRTEIVGLAGDTCRSCGATIPGRFVD